MIVKEMKERKRNL